MDCSTDLPEDINSLKELVSSLMLQNEQLSQKHSWLIEKNEQLSQKHSLVIEKNEQLIAAQENLFAAKQQLEDDNQELERQIAALTQEIEVLKERLKILQARQYGQSSEKTRKEIQELQKQIKATQEKKSRLLKAKQQPKRVELDPNLPKQQEIIEAPCQCECGSKDLRNIGEDISKILMYISSVFYVKEQIRPRVVCNKCGKFMQGYAPSNTIDKGRADASVLAHIITNKFAYHLPLHRQQQMYEHMGVKIPRSTMCSWLSRCAQLLSGLVDEIKRYIFNSSHIHSDDTSIKVLAKNKTKTAAIWAYLKSIA